MVKIVSVMALMAVLCASTLACGVDAQKAEPAATEVCTLTVSGMTCAGCEAAVRIAARSLDGVIDAKASYADRSAEVTYHPAKTTPEAIAQAISDKSGFKAEPRQRTAKK